jgi:hypothetical protein
VQLYELRLDFSVMFQRFFAAVVVSALERMMDLCYAVCDAVDCILVITSSLASVRVSLVATGPSLFQNLGSSLLVVVFGLAPIVFLVG